MVGKKVSKKDPEVPLWMVDGFVGILALVIYNFLIYLLRVIGIGGIILKLDDAVGYFGLNTYMDFGFSSSETFLGIIIFFLISFSLGIWIGGIVRKRKNKK